MIPMDMTPVLDEYLRKIWAYDETAEIVDYKRRDPVKGDDYWFPGVLIPPTDEDLNMLEEGDIKTGAIIVYTRGKELFYLDLQETEETQKQTFVKYKNKVYRIKSDMDRMDDGMYRKYAAVRYIKKRT